MAKIDAIARQLKALVAACAVVTPIVVGVTVTSAAPASASCRASDLHDGVYRADDDRMSRVDIRTTNSCSTTVEAHSTCDDDPTSDCSFGVKTFPSRQNRSVTYSWSNAIERVTVRPISATQIAVTDYTAYDDGQVVEFTVTMYIDR